MGKITAITTIILILLQAKQATKDKQNSLIFLIENPITKREYSD